jgi:hypothetical protein
MAQNSGLTLSDMTQFGRQAVKVIAIVLVVLIVGRFAIQSFVSFWSQINPPAPTPPTVGFGLLPTLRFSENAQAKKPTAYNLQLPSGVLPSFGDRAKVFFMPSSSLGLLSDENARKFASNYGFVFEPTILSTRLYRWQRSTPLQTTLELDIQTYQMRLTTNYLSRPDLLINSTVPEKATAERILKSFLSSGNIADSTVATNSAETTYLKLQGTQLVEALSYSDADFVRVSLNRYPVDGQYQMYTPDGSGIIEAIISGGLSSTDAVVSFVSNFHPADKTAFHTYPLRTTTQAWNVLQAGEGYIARNTEPGEVVIRSVVLGYYDDFEPQSYLQPIYVFIGDNDFLGYVPAIDPEFTQHNTQASP